MKRLRHGALLLSATFLLMGTLARGADEVFAVVTLKDGLAAALAHNHLVVAPEGRFTVAGGQDPKDPLKNLSIMFETSVANLVIDDPKLQERWFPAFNQLAILTAPFSPASASDRQTMREAMLDAGQLDAKQFPTIKARVSGFRPEKSTVGTVTFDYMARADVTLHGKTVTKDIHVARSGADGLTLTLYAPFLFTDFAVEPYAAFLGAVKVRNQFHVYVATTIEVYRARRGPRAP